MDETTFEQLRVERSRLIHYYDQIQVDREWAKRGLKHFINRAWQYVDPAKYSHNWHIDAVSEHLQAVTQGQISRLIINLPPGYMKSLITCVFWPAWEWSQNPTVRWTFASYAEALAVRDSLKMRWLLDTDWYKERWPEVIMMKDHDLKTEYVNTQQGLRMAVGVSGSVMGKHANRQVVDDPHKFEESQSSASRQNVIDWWGQSMSTRLLKDASRVVVMQRLHENDLTGHLLREDGSYVHLCLPETFEDFRKPTSIGFVDPRKTRGELLWPELFPQERHDTRVKELGPYGAAGQLQQRPAPEDGGIVKKQMFKRYYALPEMFDMVWQSWDLALTDTNDYVSGSVLGSIGPDIYLIKRIHGRYTFTQTLDLIRNTHREFAEIESAIVIEDKANGPAAMDVLRKTVPGIIAFNPRGNKMVRLQAVVPMMAAGNFYIPDESIDPTIEQYVIEFISFPNGDHDDQIDSTSQGIIWWRENKTELMHLDLSGGERQSPSRIC